MKIVFMEFETAHGPIGIQINHIVSLSPDTTTGGTYIKLINGDNVTVKEDYEHIRDETFFDKNIEEVDFWS